MIQNAKISITKLLNSVQLRIQRFNQTTVLFFFKERISHDVVLRNFHEFDLPCCSSLFELC